jgi:hypothetical protein
MRDATGQWSTARRLTVGGRASDAIFAGVTGRGRDVMVWAAEPIGGGAKHILWSQRRPQRAWTTPLAIPGQTVIPETFFLSSAGWAVIAWEERGVGYVRVLTPQGRWKQSTRVTPLLPRQHHDAVGEHQNLRAVISSAGAVTASWVTVTVDARSRTDGSYQRGGLTAAGKRLAPVTVASGQSAYAGRPYLDGSASGNSAALHWDATDRTENVVYRLAGEGWQRHSMPPGCGDQVGSSPALAALSLSDHRLAVWWQSWTSTVAGFCEARYDGGSWTSPSAVAQYDDTGPRSLAEYGAVSDTLEVFGSTQYRVTSPEGRHDASVRTTTATGTDELTLGPAAIVRGVAAAGPHEAVVWSGQGGLFVQTR